MRKLWSTRATFGGKSRHHREDMALEETRKKGIEFFTEAIEKWNRLVELYNTIRLTRHSLSCEEEANKILAWFQENYNRYVSCSDFRIKESLFDGKEIERDPVFDVIFQGASIKNICRHPQEFASELNMGVAFLRGHLASIKNKKELDSGQKAPMLRLEKILSRYHLVAGQLRRRRRNRNPFLIEDEYDVQDLLHAILKLDFDDIRTEEWTPSYAGGASRIDMTLRNEKILIETKKASENLKEKQIGSELIIDITRYKTYPDIETLVCFVYDPDSIIINPKGLQSDLEKLSTKELGVRVIICPSS